MEYRSLGGTGLRISRLVLGCGNFGGIGSAPELYGRGEDEAQAFALMDRALDAGINLFDTADAYGGGRSEAFIGAWLAARGAHTRQRVLLSSKVFNPVGPGPNDRGLSRRHILTQVDASLRRLRTDRLDLYLIHEPDPGTPVEETLEALDDLVRAGKVLYIGASNIEAWRLGRALAVSDAMGRARFCVVQNGYSLLDRGPEREVLPFCADRQLGFAAFSPLGGGWLTGKYQAGRPFPAGSRMTLRPEPYRHLIDDAAVFRGLTALGEDARARRLETATLALAWVLSHPDLTAAIVGPRQPGHLDSSLAALALSLDWAERARLAGLFGGRAAS